MDIEFFKCKCIFYLNLGFFKLFYDNIDFNYVFNLKTITIKVILFTENLFFNWFLFVELTQYIRLICFL